MSLVSSSPPRAPPIKYTAPLGTRWDKEKAAAGGASAFNLPTDPKTLGPWILGECVGKGASGRVKIARHRRTGQLAAVKILPVAALVNSRASLATQQAKSDKQRLGIDREITMMKLMNHPNIMRIYDVYEGDKELYLVLEYIEGGELFDFLVNRGRLPPQEALQYFKQIVYGLNYAHTFSIIHRDLKPENILIASLSPPLIKIADWGMAAFAPPSLQLETSCGSPHYASPEIVNGEKYEGNATDIWSCGVILFALLTGRLPFDDKNVRTLLSKVKSGKYEMPAWIDPLAKDLLSKMLVVDFRKRITIPEILSHPWLINPPTVSLQSLNPTARINQAAPSPSSPSLPPSPSTLARPILSPDLIDPELLSSLRIIWGRHTDPNGESIKRDLCSPAGQGVHAKAFYFLLGKYREDSLRNRIEEGIHPKTDSSMSVDRFNLGWELDHNGTRLYGAKTPCHFSPCVPPCLPVFQSQRSSMLPPLMIRGRTVTEGNLPLREKPTSPIGPRPPSVRKDTWQSQTQPYVGDLFDQTALQLRPFSFLNAGRGGPRPIPRRGYTYTATQVKNYENEVSFPLSGMGFSRNLQQLQGKVPFGQGQRRPKSSVGLPASFGEKEKKDMFNSRVPSMSQFSLPQVVARTRTVVPTNPPVRPAMNHPESTMNGQMDEKTPLLALSKDAISEQDIVMAHITEKFDTPMDLVNNPHSSETRTTTGQREGVSNSNNSQNSTHENKDTHLTANDDKENKSFCEEGWSYIGIDSERSTGVGLGVGRDIGNVMNSNPPSKGKKDKMRKSKPPPLDLPPLNRKRSTLSVLGSPINLTSPVHHTAPNSSRLLVSPVVGEFKGWFSNLFNWKSHGHGGIVYSIYDLPKTVADVGAMLETLGVAVEGSTPDSAEHSSDLMHIFKCRVDQQSNSDTSIVVNMKPSRFRFEFSSGTGSGPNHPLVSPNGISHLSTNVDKFTAPNPGLNYRGRPNMLMSKSSQSPNPLFNGEFPPGCLCAVAVVYEKGSLSTFKTVWKKTKELYSDDPSAYPCFSPAIPNTPLVEQHQRLAL